MEETRQANVEDRALDRERSADIKLPRWSIRTWLVALVVVSVVPLVAFVGALTWLSYKSARETAVTSVQTATRALPRACVRASLVPWIFPVLMFQWPLFSRQS